MGWLQQWDRRNQRFADAQREPGAEEAYERSVRRRGDPAPWEDLLAPIPVVGWLAFVVSVIQDRKQRRRTGEGGSSER